MRTTLIVFTASVFLSALLLFAVQPMFTRMVLPRLGGSPAVWSVAMVFFQSMLLAGYAYAHLLMRMAPPKIAVGVHVALTLAAALTLPLAIAPGWGRPPQEGEAIWLLGLFAVSIGLPFFALAANNPLLQDWFVRTGHKDGSDPYFLYAASNAGSFLALLAYPVVIEPGLALADQLALWTGGFILLLAMLAVSGYLMIASPRAAEARKVEEADVPAPALTIIGRWIFLAAVPSGLLVAVTSHISTDVAAVPLLWVIPLALYLLTFVIVFQRNRLIPHRWILILQPFVVAGIAAVLAMRSNEKLWMTFGAHLGAFFIIALAAHGELARLRPHPRYLTTFYLAMSAGGMVGGLFAGLLAPQLFSWIAEYPILVVLAALCRPWNGIGESRRALWFWGPALLAAAIVLYPTLLPEGPFAADVRDTLVVTMTGLAILALLLRRDALKFAAALALVLVAARLYPGTTGRPIETVRSFFGVHKIADTPDLGYRVLMHGTTIHGAQRMRGEDGLPIGERPVPLSYYAYESPMGQMVTAMRAKNGGRVRVAVVGLGSGSLACHRQGNEAWRFFEIDPDIVRLSKDLKRFTFIDRCAPDVPIVLGDARLTLSDEPDGAFDLIIVDAFSSDAIPIHLMTKEAMAIFRAKTAPEGAVAMHVSNRHLELTSVVGGVAAANGLGAWVSYGASTGEIADPYVYSSTVVAVAAKAEDMGGLTAIEGWTPVIPDPGQRVWTDDYSNIIGALLRK